MVLLPGEHTVCPWSFITCGAGKLRSLPFVWDVPLLLLGIYFLGGMFGVKTIICTFAIPAFMRLIHYVYGYDALLEPGITDRTMLNEQLLSAIFGGIVYGIGIGMIFKARATSGDRILFP